SGPGSPSTARNSNLSPRSLVVSSSGPDPPIGIRVGLTILMGSHPLRFFLTLLTSGSSLIRPVNSPDLSGNLVNVGADVAAFCSSAQKRAAGREVEICTPNVGKPYVGQAHRVIVVPRIR